MRPGRGRALLGVFVLFLLSLPYYGQLFSLDRAPLATDFGRIFLPPLLSARDALLDGEILLWDAQRFSGTPYWSLPNTAPAWPPLLLGLLAFGAVGGLNAAVLGHLAFGAWGSARLARACGAGGLGSWLAALLFVHAPMIRLAALYVPFEAMAMSFAPWVILLFVRQAPGPQWPRVGLLAGLAWACVPWAGGYLILLYGVLAFGLVAVVPATLSPDVPRGRAIARAAGSLAVFGATLAAVSAGRLLPLVRWTALTDRAEGIDYETAALGRMDLPELIANLGDEGWSVLLLAVLAIAVTPRRDRGRVFALGSVLVLAVAIAHGLLQRPLYEYLPGYDRIREPRRAWLLLPTALPALAGVGLTRLGGLLQRGPVASPARAAALAAVLVLIAAENVRAWDRVLRYPRPSMISLEERLAANEIHAELARRADEETLFRVLDPKDLRPKYKVTADLVRAGHGLQSVEGLLGSILVYRFDEDFALAGRRGDPRIWGLMNARYVTSEIELQDALLVPLGRFEEDPEELASGTDGPFLYENRAALPRALWTANAIVLLDGEKEEGWRVLSDGAWEPRRAVYLRATAQVLAAEDAALLERVDAVLVGRGAQSSVEALARRAQELGVVWRRLPPANGPDGSLTGILPDDAPYARRLADPEYGWRDARVQLGAPPEPGWLVLAETYAIYPGWRAEVDGVPAPLLQANGAATAIPVPAGAREVRLVYLPDGLVPGLAISAIGSLGAILALVLLRRRTRSSSPGTS